MNGILGSFLGAYRGVGLLIEPIPLLPCTQPDNLAALTVRGRNPTNGDALTGGRVRIVATDGSFSRDYIDANGYSHVHVVPAGRYRIELSLDGYLPVVAEAEVQVAVGANVVHELNLQRPTVAITSPTVARRQYINLPPTQDDFGRVVTIEATVTPHVAGVQVHWEFDTATDCPHPLGAGLRPGFLPNQSRDVFWSYVGWASGHWQTTATATSTTNAHGVATIQFRTSQYGGDRHTVHVGLASGQRDSATAALTVWRRLYYQISKAAGHIVADPSSAPYEAVFTELVKDSEGNYDDSVVPTTYPTWMLYPELDTDDRPLLVISDDNKHDYAGFMVAPAQGTPQENRSAHIMVAGANFDPAPPLTYEGEMTARSQELRMERPILSPTLRGASFFVSGRWSRDDQRGELDEGNFVIARDRGGNEPDSLRRTNYIRLDLPGEAPDPTDLAPVRVRFSLRSQRGPYKGESFGPHSLVVHNPSTAPHFNGVVVHEIGHSVCQTPAAGRQPAGLPDHPNYYTGRGGLGPHCSTRAGDLPGVVQDDGTYAWNSGICVMFHRGHDPAHVNFCTICVPYLRAQDMSGLKPA